MAKQSVNSGQSSTLDGFHPGDGTKLAHGDIVFLESEDVPITRTVRTRHG